MQSTVTLGFARQQLAYLVPNSKQQFTDKVNQACERLLYSGKFNGSMISVAFNAISGYFTLPPQYLGVLAGTFDNWPVQTFSEWTRYMEVGWCTENEALSWGGRIQDEGDGYVTQVEIDPSGGVRIYSTGSDDGTPVRMYGVELETEEDVTDENGVRGEELILAAPYVESQFHYSDITGFMKPLTNGPLQVKVVPTNGDPVYQVAEYQSWETVPSYRRYRIGPATKTVRVLCQRRYIPATQETDILYPGSIGALKFMLKALALEDSGYDSPNESLNCENQAVRILNQEAKSLRAGGVVPIPLAVWGYNGGIPFTN